MAVLYGLLNQADLAAERLTTPGVEEEVMAAVNQSLAEHNRQLDALMSLFVTRTQEFKRRFQIANAWRLQPLDENGRALPVKPSGYYDVAWPIQMAGTAWGFNWVTREKITVGEIARLTAGHMEADVRWMRDHILAALFYKSTTNPWTFVDPLYGSLSIYGLANGDSTVYSLATGASAASTDDHLIFDATLAADTFQTLYDELLEHPENGGDVIVFIPSNVKATVEAISTFYPIEDPDLRIGAASTVLAGRLNTATPGTVLGKVEKCWVVEWKYLPDNYLIAVATEGERALAMREDPEASLRGFKLVAERDDHPWYERQFARRAGFGGWNRVNAAILKVAASYTVPTGYSSPLA
jgi:hypothetical protein